MNKSLSKIRHIQEVNLKLEKRLLSEQETTSINANLDYFSKNPKGTLVVDNMGSYLNKVNNLDVSEETAGMNSDQVIKGGTYDYQYVPSQSTMRKSSGEPVVKLFQNEKEIDMFYPKQ